MLTLVVGGVFYVFWAFVAASDLYIQEEEVKMTLRDKLIVGLAQVITTSKEQYKNDFDLESDVSLQKYVNKANPLSKNYEPLDLEKIDSEYIVVGETVVMQESYGKQDGAHTHRNGEYVDIEIDTELETAIVLSVK